LYIIANFVASTEHPDRKVLYKTCPFCVRGGAGRHSGNKFGDLTNFGKYSEQQAISFVQGGSTFFPFFPLDDMEVHRSTNVPRDYPARGLDGADKLSLAQLLRRKERTLKEVRERCHANLTNTAKKLGLA